MNKIYSLFPCTDFLERKCMTEEDYSWFCMERRSLQLSERTSIFGGRVMMNQGTE